MENNPRTSLRWINEALILLGRSPQFANPGPKKKKRSQVGKSLIVGCLGAINVADTPRTGDRCRGLNRPAVEVDAIDHSIGAATGTQATCERPSQRPADAEGVVCQRAVEEVQRRSRYRFRQPFS